jgi:GNAT superfamily N-acetyltransferase
VLVVEQVALHDPTVTRWLDLPLAGEAGAVSVTVEPFESYDDLSEEDLAAATEIANATWAEWTPSHRPMSAQARADEERFVHPPNVVVRSLARDGRGQLVGVARAGWRDPEPEPGACVVEVEVAPGARGQGVGTALARHHVELARERGRIGVTFEAAVDSVADGLCRRAGLKEDLVVDLNETAPDAAPTDLLEGWVAAGEAAAGYSLVAYDGRCPDADAEAFVAARHAMNDAPRYEGEPAWEYTVAELRAAEVACASARQGWWAIGARHEATGEIVGLTDLFLPVARPWIAFQGDTGVLDAHRGHRLGAWMKAVNHLRLRRERPEVERVQTWNASANAPMLRINHALGYRAVQRFRAWYLALG